MGAPVGHGGDPRMPGRCSTPARNGRKPHRDAAGNSRPRRYTRACSLSSFTGGSGAALRVAERSRVIVCRGPPLCAARGHPRSSRSSYTTAPLSQSTSSRGRTSGWRFLYDTVRRLATRKTGLGRPRARRPRGRASGPRAEAVELVYLERPVTSPRPARRSHPSGGARPVRPRTRLSWFVHRAHRGTVRGRSWGCSTTVVARVDLGPPAREGAAAMSMRARNRRKKRQRRCGGSLLACARRPGRRRDARRRAHSFTLDCATTLRARQLRRRSSSA